MRRDLWDDQHAARLVVQGEDSERVGPWTSGNPDIGFFDNFDGDWKAFGFS
jgi:hypothetical protein